MTITTAEFLAIFARPAGDAQYIYSADSAEFMERVLYFADRVRKESA